ncbi:LysR substrate-binding domain-containing protein [Komagataeibacter melomenusus]|nr:LysR family transcriptional regulator [Komagataeibacter melomenusus]
MRHFHCIEIMETTRNMRLAAERMNVTVAAVSKACIEIETILGGKLFERKLGMLIPTQLCTRMLTAGRKIDAELNRLTADLSGVDGGLHGTIRIGFQAPPLQNRLSRWIASIKNESPFLNVICEYGMRRPLMMGVEAGLFDLIFVDLLQVESWPRLQSMQLCAQICVVRDNDTYIPFSEVLRRWPEFVNRLWMLPMRGLALRERFDAMLATHGLPPPSITIEVNSPFGLQCIHEATNALLICADPKQAPMRLNTGHRQLHNELYMHFGMIWARDRSMKEATRHVLEIIMGDMNG